MGPDGEQLWLGPSDRDGVELLLPRRNSFVLVCPKSQPIHWWASQKSLPRDVAVVCWPHPTDPRARPILEALIAGSRAAAAVFVGDMDPYAIVQYVETRRVLAGADRPVLYGGIDDAWLDAMERKLRPGSRLERLRIRLGTHEVRLLKRLDQAMNLDALVGVRCTSLLRDGYKIELEAATNPTLYDRRHGQWVLRHLRSKLADPVTAL
jgi:hypothetical protein